MSLAWESDDLEDDLDSFLAGEQDQGGILTIAPDGDPSVHLLTAERMLRAVARRRRKLAEAEQLADVRTGQVRQWLEEQRTRFATDWLEDQLAAYHEARLLDDPRCKTISLPSGALKARKTPDQWNVENDETVLSWAHDVRPELIRTKVELDRQEMKRRLKPTGDGTVVDPDSGERVPGVTVAPGEVRFSVEVVR